MTTPGSATNSRKLPAALANIEDQVRAFEGHGSERAHTARRWAHEAERLRQVTPRVTIEDGGDTFRLAELSPGCRACKAGAWDCLFPSMRCNLSCAFCLTTCHIGQSSALSALGDDIEALCEFYASSGIAGVGISGGEPLLASRRLLHCLARLRTRRPDLYLWAYTNGLAATKPLLEALARAGLNELRFNMAATGYAHAHVTGMLRQAVSCLPRVTVEIPAIPEDLDRLRKALPVWSRAGVKHLNLHELTYEPGSPSATMPGARARCRMPDGHVCEFNPHSSDVAAAVLSEIDSRGYSLAVNYCYLGSKARQLRGRRRLMAARTLRAHERLCVDGQAETLCYFDDKRWEYGRPDALEAPARFPAGVGVALLRRMLPLSPDGAVQWTHFEVLREAAV